MDKQNKDERHALQSAAAWLERWAVHVGSCYGGAQCTCGLTFVRHEIECALEAKDRE